MRESLKIRDWEKAQQRIREWEAEGQQAQEEQPIAVDQACEDFQREAEARKLRKPTLNKYRVLMDGTRRKEKQTERKELRVEKQGPAPPGLRDLARSVSVRFLKQLDLSRQRQSGGFSESLRSNFPPQSLHSIV